MTAETWRFAKDGKSATVWPSGPLRANNGDAIMPARISGTGLGILPELILRDALAGWRDCCPTGLYPGTAAQTGRGPRRFSGREARPANEARNESGAQEHAASNSSTPPFAAVHESARGTKLSVSSGGSGATAIKGTADMRPRFMFMLCSRSDICVPTRTIRNSNVAPSAVAATHFSFLQENVMSEPTYSYELLTSANAALVLVDQQVGLMTGIRAAQSG
jgi:hypothetical protein